MNLRPIPTYRDHPATSPHSVLGATPGGTPVRVDIEGSADPVLLLFLSAACDGCADLWTGTDELVAGLPAEVEVVIVTRGTEHEDASIIEALAPPGIRTVMSSQAFADYRVSGPPFLVVVTRDEVKTEGVAWGIAETLRATRAALAR